MSRSHEAEVRFGGLVEELRKLEAFHMRCQRMILGIRWHDLVEELRKLEAFHMRCQRMILGIRWHGLVEELRKLEAFHMRCQRMILGIRWHDFVINTEVVDRTNLRSVRDVIAKRRNSLFGHVVRLDDHTPAYRALSQVAAARIGHRFGPGWRRQPGRLRHSWIQQIGDGTPFSIRAEWSKARRRGHSGLMQRISAVYTI